MQRILHYLLVLSFMTGSIALANDPICDYKSETLEKTTGIIDSIRDISKETANYAEDRRICAVKFQAKLGDSWVPTHGFYVFGSDVSEDFACDQAIEKGKIRAIKYLSPTRLTHIAEQKCKEETPPVVQVVEKHVYVDSRTGTYLEGNPTSGSLPCFLLSLFGPMGYSNPRCHAFTEVNPYVAFDAPSEPYKH